MAAYMHFHMFPADRPLVASAIVRWLAQLPYAQVAEARHLERINGEAWPAKNIRLGDPARRWFTLEHVADTEPAFEFEINPAGDELLWIQVRAELAIDNPYIQLYWMQRRFEALAADRQAFYLNLIRSMARDAGAGYVLGTREGVGDLGSNDQFIIINGVRVLDGKVEPDFIWIADGVNLPHGYNERDCVPRGDGFRDWQPR